MNASLTDSSGKPRRGRTAVRFFIAGFVVVALFWLGEVVLRVAYVKATDHQLVLNARIDALNRMMVSVDQLRHSAERSNGAAVIRADLDALTPGSAPIPPLEVPRSLRSDLLRLVQLSESLRSSGMEQTSSAAIEPLTTSLVALRDAHIAQRLRAMTYSRMWSRRMVWIGVTGFVLAASMLIASAALALSELRRRKQSEQTLRDTMMNLTRLLEALPVPVHVRDLQGRYILWNAAAELTFGRRRQDVLGMTASVVAESSLPKALEMRAAALRGEVSGPELLRVQRNDGAELAVVSTLAPYFDPYGRVTGLVGVTRDVSDELQRQEQQRQHDQQQREVVVREVHHRIKNHLQGLAALVQQKLVPAGERNDRVDEIVAQMLSLASVHGMQAQPDQQLLLTASVRAIVTHISSLTGAAIEVAAAEAGSRWCVNEPHSVAIALAVNELLTNAVKHRLTGAASPVQVKVDERSDRVVLTIRNRGVLSEDFDPHLLAYAGTGLSLVMALLPQSGADLVFSQSDGWVNARLELMRPAVVPRNEFNAHKQGVAA
jgi:PAS domain S-box-containing protein